MLALFKFGEFVLEELIELFVSDSLVVSSDTFLIFLSEDVKAVAVFSDSFKENFLISNFLRKIPAGDNNVDCLARQNMLFFYRSDTTNHSCLTNN